MPQLQIMAIGDDVLVWIDWWQLKDNVIGRWIFAIVRYHDDFSSKWFQIFVIFTMKSLLCGKFIINYSCRLYIGFINMVLLVPYFVRLWNYCKNHICNTNFIWSNYKNHIRNTDFIGKFSRAVKWPLYFKKFKFYNGECWWWWWWWWCWWWWWWQLFLKRLVFISADLKKNFHC